MDPPQKSNWYYSSETTAPYRQQGASTPTTSGDSVMLKQLSASKSETKIFDSPGTITSVAPMVSESFRQLPISAQTGVNSFLPNSSNNGGSVELGFPNVPLVSDPLVQNSQRQMFDKLQSANMLSLLGSQFPSFPIQSAAPTQGLPPTCTSPQLDKLQTANLLSLLCSQFPSFPVQPAASTQGLPSTYASLLGSQLSSFPIQSASTQGLHSTCAPPQLAQASSTPFLATLMQLCGSLNTNAAPVTPPPMNSSNLVAQLIAQLASAQLAQSAQVGPLAGLLQLIQAFVSMGGGSASAAPPFEATSHTSFLSQLSSLDPATAKQVILMLVNQLIQSGNLTDDETCQRFVRKLQSGPFSSPWQPTQSPVSVNWQAVQNMLALNSGSRENVPIAAGNIKKETISSADRDRCDGFSIPISISASPSPRSTCDVAGVKPVSDAAAPSTYDAKVDTASEQSDAEMSSAESIECQTQPTTRANGSGKTKKPTKQIRKSADKHLSTVSVEDDCGKTDTSVETVSKRRSRHNFKEVDKIDKISERRTESSGKRLRSRSKTVKYCEEELPEWLEQSDDDTSSKRKKLHSAANSDSQTNSVAKETKTNRSSSLAQSSSVLAGNASNELSKTVVKTEIPGPISILPKVNICHSPNVRYLFMGRKSDGMDWLNLVSYKKTESDDFVNQCLFCPMTSPDVKPVADHLANEHADLDFVLTNVKQPSGRVTYLACRHCNFVTFEPTLIWIHFELFHGIPGIMDGSSLPQINIGDPVNVEGISLDEPVNSRGSQPAYLCLDCMLCSNNSKNIALHVIQAHPETANFNGCFVKLMMIKTKEKDCFTFREAMYDESHADALKDVYICMLCEYSTHGAYLAMSHSLRLHQTKRLLFVCNECEYQCTRETGLTMHMANSHKFSSVSSFVCSVTLVASLSDGTFVECEIPVKCTKASDHSTGSQDCDMKSCSMLQSTAVSSSQEKRKSEQVATELEESTVTPQSKTLLLS